jgi:hypothetical protein
LILARRKADEPCQDGNVAAISLYLRVLQDRQPGRCLAIDNGVRFFNVQIPSHSQRSILSMSTPETQPTYAHQHQQALAQGEHWYIDAQTGFMVFTELYHKERGTCCLSACRHCPWGFEKK